MVKRSTVTLWQSNVAGKSVLAGTRTTWFSHFNLHLLRMLFILSMMFQWFSHSEPPSKFYRTGGPKWFGDVWSIVPLFALVWISTAAGGAEFFRKTVGWGWSNVAPMDFHPRTMIRNWSAGWAFTPSWKMMDFVNWDDEIPHISGNMPKMMATKPPTSHWPSQFRKASGHLTLCDWT